MSTFPQEGKPRRSPGLALLLLALGLTLAGLSGVAACQAQPEEDFGAPEVTTTASSAPVSRVPTTDGALPSSAGTDAPARLRVPALDLDATVEAVGIDARTGDFAVPPSVDRVGWYRYGPGFSADAGSIVIAGHVDSAAEGEGAFFKLASLDAGDPITITSADGERREFEVVARKRYEKTAIPLQKYFARDGAVRLTLITCGGPFDPETRHYRDNVVVTATARQ